MMHFFSKTLWLVFFTIYTTGSIAQGDSSVHHKDYGIINLSVANLRTKPAHSAEMATQLLLGTRIDILQKQGSNYRVRTPEGYMAWIPSSSIVPMSKAEILAWNEKDKIIYTAEFGKSFSLPHKASQRVSDLVYGNILSLQGEDHNFYEVVYPDNRVAYIPKEEAMLFINWLTTRETTPDQILISAKSMLGLPYLWGGTSVKGVDCSGFTKMSFFMNGYVIPRDASQQVMVGDTIDILDDTKNLSPEKAIKNLKPADLLFFAADKKNKPDARVTHVAIYIGNGEFIHAAGMVKINSLLKGAANYDDVQTRTIVAARRYIGADDAAIQKIEESPYYNNQ
ncbi:C40 family peptidase [Sphingobacterium sp. SGR-19]|uniref:C40 family peptidase n=1 Tax=Sphingobacterium sp. SGR-19 TaxID=2710886 RepID=UPI001F0E58CF|nr:C40 family peptidase [Sphingobacterium sp. SGR-19]